MKTLELKTSKGEWLLVDVPKVYKNQSDVSVTHIDNSLDVISVSNLDNGEHFVILNSNDAISEVCKLSEITEEQASEIVDSEYVDFIDKYLYRDYDSNNAKEVFDDKLSAIESLHSLIKSLGVNLYENTYKDSDEEYVVYFEDKNTFYNPILFKKI